MTPRPADLEPETQRNLAYAALATLTPDERSVLLYWMAEHMPSGFLTAVEGLRWEGQLPDGFDQVG
jgi:hypothetical protein